MGKQKVNIPMCAALVLLLLTMISIHMTSGLYARYTANSTATDSARVAKFDVDAKVEQVKDGEGKPIEGRFALTVTNESEVAVKYKVIVTFDEALPEDNTLSVGLTGAAGTALEGKKTYTFTNETDWKLAPNATPVEHTLTIGINGVGGWQDYTKPAAGEKVDVTLKFSVDIVAEQID